MTYSQRIKKWGEFWEFYGESQNAVCYKRLDANDAHVGFVVFRKKAYKNDYWIGESVIARAGDPMIPGEGAFGQWAWNYLRWDESSAIKKLNNL